ncbi:unnamed protein product [Rotaria magnacalcarata]|uniref:G-protein coupled receptors family 1 profile domain-containing protein n=2 Tax=Rotaria magnacalcarata TaxID=392030 RepID=A0A814RQD1_9BILA|nr:unnamed protein product [Rotaria magnacalcarata]CAF1974220.1 unnamed protein product [Rotaria magnacalcarata]CAF3983753.1 unnamed protein product [Rotaria magnacalcarata]CAF4254329.1 unnamed protein product [Rotaria magnacalcarata]
MDPLNSTMPSLADAVLIETINHATHQIVRYCSIFIFLFGSIGNILNVFVLSQLPFRLNPCAVLFLFSSAVNFIAILSGLLSRMLSGWGADLTATNRFFCKLRGFLVNITRVVAIWYILFATIDRWLLSSRRLQRRQMSSLKNAQRAMIITLILSTLIFSHVIYCQEPNLVNTPQKCYGKTQACQFLTDISFTTLTILPLLLILIFGLMTIRNIRESRARISHIITQLGGNIRATNANQQRRLAKQDHYLLIMLLIQILILFVLSLPLSFQKIYVAITANEMPSGLNTAVNNLVYNISQMLSFLANGMPFYIYTLAGGHTFREALFKFLGIRHLGFFARR